MASKQQTAQLTVQALQRACGLALVYAVLILVLPVSQATIQTYYLSPLEYRAILFIVSLPSIVAWIAAFIGYAKLREYVSLVRKTPEGTHLDLSLIHISEPTRQAEISYAVFCLKKKT